jgi:hypothetical protein
MLSPLQSLRPMYASGRGVHLPKGSLPDAWRAEQLCHLASHVTARDGSAWEPWRRKHSVELRETGRHGARALGMERLEGL